MPCCDSKPKICFRSKYTEPTTPDECRCGCGMNNGTLRVFACQLFLFIGVCFSAGTMGDCAFVTVSNPVTVRVDADGNGTTTATSLGIVSYRQEEDGRCYYWWDTVEGKSHGGDQIVHYLTNVLGNTWYTVHALSATACALSIGVFLYSTLYCCSTHVRGVRLFGGVFTWLVALMQGLGVYLVYPSRWCSDYGGCGIGRSSIWGMVAASSFFLAGFFFCVLADYPGSGALKELQSQSRGEKECGGKCDAADTVVAEAKMMEEGSAKPAEKEDNNVVVVAKEQHKDVPMTEEILDDDDESSSLEEFVDDFDDDHDDDVEEGSGTVRHTEQPTKEPSVPAEDDDNKPDDESEDALVRDPSGTLPGVGP
eukprot:jgi/Psemu1/292029/fgenesh1_pg.894_\